MKQSKPIHNKHTHKKILAALLCAALCLPGLAACSGSGGTDATTALTTAGQTTDIPTTTASAADRLAALLSPTPDDADTQAATLAGFNSTGVPTLQHGINLGNFFEAPNEGDWGMWFDDSYPQIIADAGFDCLRVPVMWSNHAVTYSPYTLEPLFLARIDHVVQTALAAGLTVIINIHNYNELATDPKSEEDRFMAIWSQLSDHYKAYPQKLIFELCNEPNGAMTAQLWNEFVNKVIPIIRVKNPTRDIMVGGVNWNSAMTLRELQLPAGDKNIIGTFHFYTPMSFTHQGAEWVDNMDQYLGTTWTATQQQKNEVTREMAFAKAWANNTGLPVFMGEFGAYSKADMASRATWTSYVSSEATSMGFGWSYWEFCAGFGAWDPDTQLWHAPLLAALIPNSPSLAGAES